MSLSRGYFAALVVVASAATSIAVGAMAAADPVWPVAGNGSAADTIRELQDQGYTVAINGSITAPLERCLVTAIHNPDRSGGKPGPSTTVYVDVSCPPERDFDFGVGIGVGVGIGF